MNVNLAHLQRCLDKVQEIVVQYRLVHIGSDDPCRSVGNLKTTVETYLNVKVQLFELPLVRESSVVLGMFVMTKADSTYDICYVSDLAEDWKRFVICKELFHILIDQELYRDMDIAAHLDALTIAFPQDDSRPRASVMAEFLAEVAAMEFLFPRARRVVEQANGLTLKQIGLRYQVPLFFVEKYLSAPWMKNLDPVRILAV